MPPCSTTTLIAWFILIVQMIATAAGSHVQAEVRDLRKRLGHAQGDWKVAHVRKRVSEHKFNQATHDFNEARHDVHAIEHKIRQLGQPPTAISGIWVGGDTYASCTDICANQGARCDAAVANAAILSSAQTEADAKALFGSLGVDCSSFYSGFPYPIAGYYCSFAGYSGCGVALTTTPSIDCDYILSPDTDSADTDSTNYRDYCSNLCYCI
mmetsp:Transcript_4063/g.5373  ORF Transcript_4063/g.5373 Transcript_4063/m.5373 type:complete len:211 (-) Transcript_4063:192-824(-)